MSWVGPSKWHRSIFTKEKRFCLDGPHGKEFYWWNCKTPLVFATNKINGVKYGRKLQDVYESFAEEHYPRGAILVQDMATAHTAALTKDYFMDSGITVLPSPLRSLDMNVIENCCVVILVAVYDAGCQYDKVEE